MQKSLFEIPQPNEAGQPPLQWVLTRTGYCLAEKSAVNGAANGYGYVQ